MPDPLVTRLDLDNAIAPVAREVHEIDLALQGHLRHSDVQDARLEDLIAVLPRLRAIEDWRIELEAYGRLLKLTFGVSLVSAAVSLLTLIDLVRHSAGL